MALSVCAAGGRARSGQRGSSAGCAVRLCLLQCALEFYVATIVAQGVPTTIRRQHQRCVRDGAMVNWRTLRVRRARHARRTGIGGDLEKLRACTKSLERKKE